MVMTHDREILLIRVGVRGIDHDRVKRDTLLGEPERGINVLLGGSI